MACGGPPMIGGEAFESQRWIEEFEMKYFTFVGAIAKRRMGLIPVED
jgi:hypothetical protein